MKKGKQVTYVPKGSNKLIEQAKQTWFVEFYYLNPITKKDVRIRITNNLNRIKDPLEKSAGFEELLNTYKHMLENGYNPFDKRTEAKERELPLHYQKLSSSL
ncbi:hypothetical protein [Pedobacter steynii]